MHRGRRPGPTPTSSLPTQRTAESTVSSPPPAPNRGTTRQYERLPTPSVPAITLRRGFCSTRSTPLPASRICEALAVVPTFGGINASGSSADRSWSACSPRSPSSFRSARRWPALRPHLNGTQLERSYLTHQASWRWGRTSPTPLGRPTRSGARAWVYRSATGWQSIAPMSVPRLQPIAVVLPDGRLLVVGGSDGFAPGPVSTAEIYDPQAGSWSPTSALNGRHISRGFGAVSPRWRCMGRRTWWRWSHRAVRHRRQHVDPHCGYAESARPDNRHPPD